MNFGVSANDAGEAASAIDWWVDAGVDVLVEDAPQPWINRKAAAAPAPAAPVEQALPGSLDGLLDLIMRDPDLREAGPVERRIAPFGKPGSAIMIVTDMPEADDLAAGHLLSGEVGKLFDGMLGAIQLDRSSVYCVPLCPARTPSGRLDDAAAEKLAEIARQHVHLAAPKRLWLVGQTTSRALLGAEAVGNPGELQLFNHKGGNTDCVASMHPRLLLQNPGLKRRVWNEMKVLVGGMA